MTAFSTQVTHGHSPSPAPAPVSVPSSFPPANFMPSPSAVGTNNKMSSNTGNTSNIPPITSANSNVHNPNNASDVSKMNSQGTNQMKPSQIPSHNRNVPAPIPATTNQPRMMAPNVQPLPAPIPPPNMKPQFPALTQIMHKPNMPNNMPMPNLNNSANPTSAPNPLPTSVPTPTVPQPKSKSSKKSKAKNNNSNNPLTSSPNSSNVGAHGENTGRWTQEEHRLFLEGLEKHGKGWKKIASLIKSRTVVQIRTHAQKYFQKLAKARHNGEEGDVSMEGRGGVGIHCGGGSGPGTGLAGGMSIPSLSGDQLKRRRNNVNSVGGTKRKSIETVVTSAHREGKRLKEVNDPLVMPSISPCLAPFVMHSNNNVNGAGGQQMQNNGTTEMVPPSGPSLEESLYRFLTPMSTDYSIQAPSTTPSPNPTATQPNGMKPQSNDPNNQAQFIVLPNNNDHMQQFAEGSPTCVTDIPSFPTFPSSKLAPTPEPPQWYARGADVDELLHDADALNWLADSGDLDEAYSHRDSLDADFTPNPVHFSNSEVVSLSESEGGVSGSGSGNSGEVIRNLATDALPPVVSSTSSEDIHGLPSLLDSGFGAKSRSKLSTPNLFGAGSMIHPSSGNLVDENFSVFDSAMDEQAFVSALLESNENAALSVSNDL